MRSATHVSQTPFDLTSDAVPPFCNGILLPKLFWPDQEKLLKLEAEYGEFAKFLRSLEQFIHTVKVRENFW